MQGVAAIGVCLGIVRLQRQRAVMARQRFLIAFQVMECGAAIGMRLDRERPQRERVLIARQCLVIAAELAQGDAMRIEGIGLRRICRNSLLARRQRFFEALQLEERIGSVEKRAAMAGFARQCRLVFEERGIGLSKPRKR
jgi:hypothetical protein